MIGLRLKLLTYSMKVTTIVVTRSGSCHVKTLHTILRMNIQCIQKDVQNQILFVNDDPYAKADAIQKYIKDTDRIFFIDFGVLRSLLISSYIVKRFTCSLVSKCFVTFFLLNFQIS